MERRILAFVGLLSVPATLLWVFLTPVHALADRVWQDYDGSMDRYEFWGRWTVLGYIGAIAGLWAFHRLSAPAVPDGLLVPIATGISILAVSAAAGLIVEHPVAFADGET